MNRKYDVLALGELLIDFTENGVSNQKNRLFEANPGGAPCNVLAMLSKLGRRTAFVGKVGQDSFGMMLKDTLEKLHIDTAGLSMDSVVHTTLAFVHTLPDGDREFSFYRNPGADMMLQKEDIPFQQIAQSRIFHFGTLSMTHAGCREATIAAVDAAKQADCLISFDPNLRPPLWNDMEDARAQMDYGMRRCDVLKIADNELSWFTGCGGDFDKGIAVIKNGYSIPLISLSLGRKGSRAYWRDTVVEAPAYLTDGTVDTTGAGDTFCACVLDGVLKYGLDQWDEIRLLSTLQFANTAASIVTTRKGALCVMPSIEEIHALIHSR